MSPTHDLSQPWPFKLDNGICSAGYESSVMETISDSKDEYSLYQSHIQWLPSKVIIPASAPVKHISLVFGTDNELIICKILEALSDGVTSNIRIAKIADEVYDGLSIGTRGPKNRVAYLDKVVSLEQARLDIKDILKVNGCYVESRWMPYLYETILPDYSLLLTLPKSFDEFCDNLSSRDYW
jgi:hypothetical protein